MRNIGYENTNNYFNINENENYIKENKNKRNKKSFLSCIYSIFSCKKEKNKIINRKVLHIESIKNNVLNEINENQDIKSNKKFYIMKRSIRNFKREIFSDKKTKKSKKRNLKNSKSNYDADYNRNENYDADKDFISYKKKGKKKCNIERENNLISCCIKEPKNENYSKDLISNNIEDENQDNDKVNIECSPKKRSKKNKECNKNKDISEIIDVKEERELLNFDELILEQDIIEGNWKKNNKSELLIKEEKNLYEKIKKFSENKGINDENGIITLFILFYIFKKKTEKIEELKFIIEKAKNYIQKIFNSEYDEIVKELDLN